MAFRRLRFVIALVLVAALGSCKVNTINSFPSNPANIRYASFMPNAPAVDVKVQNNTTWTAVPFESITNYQSFDNVQTSFGVYLTDTGATIAESSASLSAKATYSLVGFGTIGNPKLMFQDDEYPDLGSGNMELRLTHLGFGFGVVDVYITAPDVDIANVDPTYTLSFGSNTSFQRVTAGPYRVRVTVYSTKSLMYDSGPLDFPVNSVQSIFLYGITSTHTFNASQVAVQNSVTKPLPSLTSTVRIFNAGYQTTAIDVQDNGVALVTNLAFPKAVAGYLPILAGSNTFTVNLTAAPGSPLSTLATTIAPSLDTTLLVSGPNDALVITPMSDDNLPPDSSAARLRVVNAAPDITAFDVSVDDVVVATNVTYPGPSPYFYVQSGNHTIKLLSPGTTTPIFTVNSTAFGGNNVYTVYLMGPSSALQDVVTQDNNIQN
ncbi:MAG: DUF4397 domain-containing protein [Proteobacteria bacterium]|nr:DUF4397 domain-containing protein [Pseudomonadota bacterium]